MSYVDQLAVPRRCHRPKSIVVQGNFYQNPNRFVSINVIILFLMTFFEGLFFFFGFGTSVFVGVFFHTDLFFFGDF